MKTFLESIDILYQKKEVKKIYTLILTSLTIILLIIVPFFIERTETFGSAAFDLLVRIYITYSNYSLFHFVSHLDQYYAKFYQGASMTNFFAEPDILKKIVNIAAAIFAGCAGGLFYYLSLSFFIPILNIFSLILSIMVGLLITLPMMSQYKKR